MASPTLTIRLTDELKEQMLSYPDINWSAFVRAAISDELERKQRSEAARLIETVRDTLDPEDAPSVLTIKAMRQGPFGESP